MGTDGRAEALKTFIEQTKLLVTLASGFLVAPAAAVSLLKSSEGTSITHLSLRLFLAAEIALIVFDSRFHVLNTYIDPDRRGSSDDIVKRLDQIEFTNWLEGLGSIVLIPALIRAVSTRTFLDLMFGRIILLSYFDPSRFLTKCRAEGIKAGFVSRRWTDGPTALGLHKAGKLTSIQSFRGGP